MVASSCARGRLVAAIVLAAALLVSAAVVGCGGSYKEQAKDIIEEWSREEQRCEDTFGPAMAGMGDSVEQDIVLLEQARPMMAEAVAAAVRARTGLQALAPPDAAAQAVNDDLLAALRDFSERAQDMYDLLVYLQSAFEILAEVVPQEDDTGVWREIGILSGTGVDASNVATALSPLEEAAALTRDAASAWGDVEPPVAVAAAHDLVETDLQALGDVFNIMAQAAATATDSGSQQDLAGLHTVWEQAEVQFDAFFADLDAWFDDFNALGEEMSDALDAIQEDLALLVESLAGL